MKEVHFIMYQNGKKITKDHNIIKEIIVFTLLLIFIKLKDFSHKQVNHKKQVILLGKNIELSVILMQKILMVLKIFKVNKREKKMKKLKKIKEMMIKRHLKNYMKLKVILEILVIAILSFMFKLRILILKLKVMIILKRLLNVFLILENQLKEFKNII